MKLKKTLTTIAIVLCIVLNTTRAIACGENEALTTGIELYNKKDYIGAYNAYTKVINENPENYEAYFKRGMCRYRLGSENNAIVDVLKSGVVFNRIRDRALNEQPPTAKGKEDNWKNKDKIFDNYMYFLKWKIKANWNPNIKIKNSKTEIIFRLDKQGDVKWLRLKTSSGNREFDNSAILAFLKSVPFKRLPKKFTGQDVDILYTFTMHINQ